MDCLCATAGQAASHGGHRPAQSPAAAVRALHARRPALGAWRATDRLLQGAAGAPRGLNTVLILRRRWGTSGPAYPPLYRVWASERALTRR